MLKNIVLLIFLVATVSCSYKYKILDIPLISMTNGASEKGSSYIEKNDIEYTYCYKRSMFSTEYVNVGYIDEVLRKAQSETKADYISDASFWMEGSCITLNGTVAFIKK